MINKALAYIKDAFGNGKGEELSKADISRTDISISRQHLSSLLEKAEDHKSSFDEKIEEYEGLVKSKPSKPILGRIEKSMQKSEDKYLSERLNLIEDIKKAQLDYTQSLENHIDLLKGVTLDTSLQSWNDEINKVTGDFRYKEWLKDTLDRTRDTMPQIDSDKIDEVLIHFGSKSPNSKVKKKEISIKKLLLAQNEINEDKVIDMIKNYDGGYNPIIVSKDNRIIDGSHRFAMLCEFLQDEETVSCYQIDLPIKEAIRRLNLMKVTRNDDIKKAFDIIKKAFNEDLISLEQYKEAYDKFNSLQ